jgi:hypothetical protein
VHPPALTVSELARVAVGAEPDRVVVDVQVQLPPVGVGGKPDVAAFGASGCQGNLGLHADESVDWVQLDLPGIVVGKANLRIGRELRLQPAAASGDVSALAESSLRRTARFGPPSRAVRFSRLNGQW